MEIQSATTINTSATAINFAPSVRAGRARLVAPSPKSGAPNTTKPDGGRNCTAKGVETPGPGSAMPARSRRRPRSRSIARTDLVRPKRSRVSGHYRMDLVHLAAPLDRGVTVNRLQPGVGRPVQGLDRLHIGHAWPKAHGGFRRAPCGKQRFGGP